MTNDSKLFPPRPWWEERGYRPDEYSRWLKGDWRPVAELWAELGIDPARVVPAEVELEDWLFDTSAGPERRMAEARFALGHLLKPGDVTRTECRLCCAEPPYDTLPVSRADIPAGIIVSREADAWIREERVEDVALPLYEGRMIGQFDFSQKGWVSGKGRGAVWRDIPWERKQIEPQYLMRETEYRAGIEGESGSFPSASSAALRAATENLSLIDITSSTNTRTTFTAVVPAMPHGHSAPVLKCSRQPDLPGIMNSLVFDWATRLRLSGVHVVWAILEELPLPPDAFAAPMLQVLGRLATLGPAMSIANTAGTRRGFEPLILSLIHI